jgi:hypothetical protein
VTALTVPHEWQGGNVKFTLFAQQFLKPAQLGLR